MSDPTEPKGPPALPVEGPTTAFRVKIDGWINDLFDTPSPEPAPAEPAAEAPPAVEGDPRPPAG
jgi:hypothetical protein